MQVNVQANGFDLSAHIRGFVEHRMLAALGRFDRSIEFVDVGLEAVKGRAKPDTTVCSVVVTLHPFGNVRSIASHAWMNVAINRAASDAGSQVEQEVRRRRDAAASAVIGQRLHERPLALVLDGNRISPQQRETLKRPENYGRPVMVHEQWAPGAEHEDEAPRRNGVRRHGLRRDGRRRSRPLTRIY